MDILGLPGYDEPAAPDPDETGPSRVRALLTVLSLSPGPAHFPYPPQTRRFGVGGASVELICDDPIALAAAVEVFSRYELGPGAPPPRWTITVARAASLAAAPHAFVAMPLVAVDHELYARHHQSSVLGDTWWIPEPAIVIHNGPRSRWVGARYTDPAAALFWARRLVGRVFTAQHPDFRRPSGFTSAHGHGAR